MARINFDSNISEFLGSLRNLRGIFQDLPGNVRTVIGALRNFRIALVSTGVGAVVVAMGSLIAAFSDFQPVIDRVNEALGFLSGLFQGLLREIREFVTGNEESTQSILETARASAELERASQRLRDREIELITVQAERRVELERLRLAAADQTATEEERLAALRDAIAVQQEIFDTERELAAERVRILEETADQAANNAEAERELQQARAALIMLDAQQAQQSRELVGVASGLERAIMQREEATRAAQEATEDLSGANDDLINSEERLQMILRETFDLLTQRQREAERAARVQQMVDDEVTLSRISNISAIGDALTTLAGGNKGLAITGLLIEQGSAVATAIVQGQIAAAAALAPPPIGLGPVVGAPLAGAIQGRTAFSVASIVAATAAGIQQINQSGGPAATGVAGAGGASSVPFGPTVTVPQNIQTESTQAPLQQMIDAMGSSVSVVTTGEIQDATERNARIRNKRRLNRN